MARTNATKVCDILDTVLTDGQVAAFILTANLVVTQYLGTTDVLAPVLTEIETYLAAHLATIRDPRTKTESADGVAFTFEGMTGLGLEGSKYGQTVILLDPTGTFAELGKAGRSSWVHRIGDEVTSA